MVCGGDSRTMVYQFWPDIRDIIYILPRHAPNLPPTWIPTILRINQSKCLESTLILLLQASSREATSTPAKPACKPLPVDTTTERDESPHFQQVNLTPRLLAGTAILKGPSNLSFLLSRSHDEIPKIPWIVQGSLEEDHHLATTGRTSNITSITSRELCCWSWREKLYEVLCAISRRGHGMYSMAMNERPLKTAKRQKYCDLFI